MRALAAALLLLGCGSSTEPQQHPAPDVGFVEIDAAPPPTKAVRTMKTVGLFGDTSIDNLFMNPSFEPSGFGVGQWISSYGAALRGDGPELSQLVLSDSPIGTALPVGTIADAPADAAPKLFTLIAQTPGGPGPFVLSMWIASEQPIAEPISDTVRVSIVGAKTTGLSGTEIAQESETTIAGRAWHHYRGEIPGPFSMGAYVMIRFRPSKSRWYLQAPELVPKKLMSNTAALVAGKPFEVSSDERAAIAAYRIKVRR